MPHSFRHWLRILPFLAVWLASAGCEPDDGTDSRSFGATRDSVGGSPGQAGNGAAMPSAPGPTAPSSSGETAGGGCKAGHYVGSLQGTYRSPLDPGAGLLHFDLMIQSVGDLFDESVPGFELWLEEAGGDGSGDDCSLGSEFCVDYVVSGGRLRGTANAYFFVNAPFEAELTGELDCSRGRFRGRLENGFYVIYDEALSDLVGLRYEFEGTIEADYDSETFSFVNGVWEVQEDNPPPEPPPPPKGWGGEGDWHAGFVE